MEYEIMQYLIPVAAAAAAWGGSRQALNGTKERVKRIETNLDDHIADEALQLSHTNERIAVVETKVDVLIMKEKGR